MSGLVLAATLLGTHAARAEGPSPCPPSPSAASPTRADEREFDRSLQRFQKLWALTQSLVEEHERQAFVQATERYERFAELTRELAARHAAEEQQAFDASVALYVQKRELTEALVRKHASAR